MLAFASFRLDLDNEQLWGSSRLITIQPKTFAVLRYLAERPQQLVTKRELLSALWGDVFVGDSVLKTHLKEIRRALGDSGKAPRFIQTVHRRGYRFVATLRRHAAPEAPGEPSRAPLARGVLVGREAELATLHAALTAAERGEGRVVFVTGEPGMGKTVLVNTLVAELQRRGEVWVATGQCIEQYGAGAAYLPVIEALGKLARGPDAGSVVDVLRRLAPSWLVQLPELSQAAASGIATPERLLRELAEAALALSRLRLLVWVLEDLHWADYSTLDLISYLARRADGARVLILCTYRTVDVRGTAHPLWAIQQSLQLHEQCEELELQGLTERDVVAYLEWRFAGLALPAAFSQLLRARTSGNPLFIGRVVDSLIKSRMLEQVGGAWVLNAEHEQVARSVPASIGAMIEGEIERLSDFERLVLEAASVFGMEFSSVPLAMVVKADALRVEEQLARWSRQGRFLRVIEERTGSSLACEFVHALYHQVIYHRIGPARLARLHQLAGECLEALQGEAVPPVVLAVHFERAFDAQRAVHYRRMAGWQALRQSAYREAVTHFEAALTLSARIADAERKRRELEIRVALGVPLAMMLGYAAPEVERVYLRAAELCTELGETLQSFPVMSGLAAFYVMRGRYEKALALGTEFLALAQDQGDLGAELEANVVLGSACVYLGKLSVAVAHFDQVLRLYDRERQASHQFVYQLDAYVTAHFYRAWLFWLMGDAESALTSAQEGLRFAQERGDAFAMATSIFNLGLIHQWRGEPEATKWQADALTLRCQEHGFSFLLATACELRGAALVQGSELEAGLALLRNGWAAHRATGAELGRTYWRAVLAEACLGDGLLDEASQVLAEALEFARQHAEHCWEPELYRIYAELSLVSPEHAPPLSGAGRRLSAAEAFAEALAMARRTGAKALELRAALSMARHWASHGNTKEAARLLDPLCEWFKASVNADLNKARALLVACTGTGAAANDVGPSAVA